MRVSVCVCERMTLKDARELEDFGGLRLERWHKFLDLLCGVDPRPRPQSSFNCPPLKWEISSSSNGDLDSPSVVRVYFVWQLQLEKPPLFFDHGTAFPNATNVMWRVCLCISLCVCPCASACVCKGWQVEDVLFSPENKNLTLHGFCCRISSSLLQQLLNVVVRVFVRPER
jgi:hypothetical protein